MSKDCFRGRYVLGGDNACVCMALDISTRQGKVVDELLLVKFKIFVDGEVSSSERLMLQMTIGA